MTMKQHLDNVRALQKEVARRKSDIEDRIGDIEDMGGDADDMEEQSFMYCDAEDLIDELLKALVKLDEAGWP